MRPTRMIAKETEATPKSAGVGLAIGQPTPAEPGSAWIHGRLTVRATTAEERLAWLRSIFVTAVSEAWQVPLVASLTRGEPRDDVTWIEGDDGTASLPFAVDLADLFAPARLQPDALYVHLSAREHASAVVIVPADRG